MNSSSDAPLGTLAMPTGNGGPRRSVRTLLVLLVLACLLPGVIGATALFIYEYRQARAQLEEITLGTARALAQAVDSQLLRAQAVAQTLAASEMLDRGGDLAQFHRRAREVMEASGLGTNVVLRDERGRQILNTAVDFGSPLAPPPAPDQVRGLFATGQPVISDLFIGPVLNRPIMRVEVPVIRNDKVIYALAVGLLPEDFNHILEAQNLPAGWIAGVFDSSGTFIARTLAPEKFVGQPAPEGLRRAMRASPEGSVEVTTPEGIDVLSSFSRSPLTGWRVSIAIPRAIFETAMARPIAMLALGVAVLFGIGLVLARLVARRIARSVEALTAPAVALGKGEEAPMPRVEVKEAADVAAALSRAGRLLRERAETLRARDARLRESEKRFRLLADNIAQLAWMADGEGRIFWYNRRWFDYTGTTLEDMQGWGWQKVHHPEHVERVVAKIRHCFETGEPWEDIFPLRGVDGRYRWFLSRAIPERDDAGRVVRWFGTNTDVTEQRETEEELSKFKRFADHANDVHLLLDQAGRIRYANRLACERLGYGEEELLGLTFFDLDPLRTPENFRELFARCKEEVRIPPFESMRRRKDGTTFPVEVTVTVRELNGEWLMFSTSRDISERKQSEERVREAALHDALTGLANRALVFEYCEHLLAAARRGHGHGALLFIDLDRFKPINDLHGHEAGDRVLQEVGRRLSACTREEDLVGRLGGDEFVVVLPCLDAEQERAAVVARHVIEKIGAPFHVNGLELSISPSIGISVFPEQARDVNTLIHRADMAMYHAKQSGRANYQVYTPELDRRAGEAHALEQRLKKALRQDGLALHYQPVIDIASGRLIGAEALVRLDDGGAEAVGPARFIPIAEAAGLIGELGEWVAAEACRQQEAWRDLGLRVTVAINVSPLQFRQRGFADRLHDIIATTGIDPSCLEIEVTESTVMENVDDAIAILKRIKALGVKVALDDFGTGYSSLASLSTLPLDKLKVDQSFVRRIEGDQGCRTVTEAIIALGHSLRLDVVGEGIESEQALRYLQAHGCNQAQGFWFSQPMPAGEFAQWHRDQRGRIVATA